tara:strand:+ start:496 stop:804 length:309 start_codon:yes stop_codon:yes gene_type:complete
MTAHETHEQYMARMSKEEKVSNNLKMLKDKLATEKQVGGDHYKDFLIQPVVFIQENELDFCEGNIIKYICRHKFKNGAEDIRKVIHYAELLLEMRYGERDGR